MELSQVGAARDLVLIEGGIVGLAEAPGGFQALLVKYGSSLYLRGLVLVVHTGK